MSPPTLPFGVRIPHARIGDPRLPVLRRRFVLRGAVLLGLCLLVVNRPDQTPAVFPVSALGLLLLGFLNYYDTHRQLRSLKDKEQWYSGIREATSTIVGEEAPTTETPIRWQWFVPALGILALTLLIGLWRYPHLPPTLIVHYGLNGRPNGFAKKNILSAFTPVLSQAILTAILMLAAFFGMGSRRDVDPARPHTSQIQQQVFRKRGGMLVAGLTALLNVILALTALTIWGVLQANPGLPWGILLAAVLPIAVVLGVAWRTGQSGSRVKTTPEKPTGLDYRDDDRYWLGGQLYVNRADPAIFVAKRYGFGWTLNMGNPVAWILLGSLLALPVLSIILTSRG